MQVVQHRPVSTRQEHTTINWSSESSRSTRTTTAMSNQVDQPLNFSIDNRLVEQHLTRLDLCSKNLKKIDKLPNDINFNAVLLDYNDITKVEQLDVLTHLIQLSISHNRLIDIRLVGRLKTLQKLNLSNNSLDSIDCLKTLPNLVMLNISSNNILNIGALNACHSLQSVDASDNSIRHIEDLSHLTTLKYLNLHKNLIDSLVPTGKYWPKSIHTLIISDNEIQDLTEMCYLSSLIDLNTFYIHNNPCLFVVDDRRGCHQPFDYRPYVLNWCLTIHNLDGILVTRKESLKSEWLLSQGKGRSFRPGEQYDLVQYLIKVCGTNADERDDLHLSRIMFQQDLYKQNVDDGFMKTSDTMKDANDTLSKDSQPKLQQSLLVSESEFVKMSSSSSSSVSTVNEHIVSDQQKISASNSDYQMQTPSPQYNQSASHNDEPITEHSSSNRYSDYDNRPIKPLDKNMLQSKLSQYPIENHSNDDTNISRPRAQTNPQQSKRTSALLAYNANRYSPKATTRGPTASAATHVNMRTKSNKTIPTQQQKRHTIAADNASTFTLLNHTASEHKRKDKQQLTLHENKNLIDDDDDADLQLKSAPINVMSSTQNTTYNREDSIELKKLTTSIETMRTSVLQAYLDLHERFTKTTELQTSALTSLWKMFETQNVNHQQETEKILQENRQLNQRLHELEARLTIKSLPLYPPLRAHISKRDAKSFFLHWVPNPLNEQRSIVGYRIYIDDVLKGSVDSGKFETIIDSIRDEGEYRIKLRAYDEHSESEDSNIVVARFRRQTPIASQSDSNSSEPKPIHRTLSDHTVENTSQPQAVKMPLRQTQSQEFYDSTQKDEIYQPIIMSKQREHIDDHPPVSSAGFSSTTPDKTKKSSEELISPIKSSPSYSNDNITKRKPPKSPSSSPKHSDSAITNGSCTKVLFSDDSSDVSATKRSPTRIGIMSRLVKSPHRFKRNNVLINALTINQTQSPTETSDTNQAAIKSVDGPILSQFEPNNSNHALFVFHHPEVTTNSTNISSSSPIQPPPIPPRNKNLLMNSFDQHSY
ncbi:unnamed protein product [Rotaria magnacalcarata]|uniref:Centrosomal protein of 97 kDa n=1 Tax=Rotaria magnacalcarata TaxID=392030 RepID=A0A816B663_9BILA|nr:unnamed protein product [Rotaria magnacalcarata]CAF2000297.1 unnamed protein product [Rotaria magnacalcarata]